jgi:hypothetical protein
MNVIGVYINQRLKDWVALEKSWTLVKLYIGEHDVRKKKKNHCKDEAGNCRKDV